MDIRPLIIGFNSPEAEVEFMETIKDHAAGVGKYIGYNYRCWKSRESQEPFAIVIQKHGCGLSVFFV